MNEFLSKVHTHILENSLLNKNELVIVAVSGGADSMALLSSLFELKDILEIDIYVCHINHLLRGEDANEDANFVKNFCEKFFIEYSIFEENVNLYSKNNKLSLEEAGRNIRYKKFYELGNQLSKKRNKNFKIALAHNKNDNAETVLMNLCRGSGLLGLSGIKVRRNNIIRPLLDISREEIEIYLKEKNITYCIDKTNFQNIYTRNILRNDILPKLKESINNSTINNIIKTAEFISEADNYIAKQAKEIENKAFIYENNLLKAFYIDELKSEDKIIRSYIIRSFISKISNKLKDIEKIHIDLIDKLIYMDTGKILHLPYNIQLQKSYSEILVINNINLSNRKFKFYTELIKKENLLEISLKNQDLEYTKYIDYDKIKNGLFFRTRKVGDYIRLKTGRKSLKSFMIDKKIPKEERENILIAYDGNEVVWIPNYRFNEYYNINESSKNILKINYKNEEDDETI